ncbi:beta-ketoacyl synthase domain-containing protein [Aspergillus violaceofuscus CBS 115571]|uniref:Beta-ketoacyl synthase domain-containing protein n=1 Tax=Aspergillus violaceofuscus (strain CBS 115571) TaxID=1450538 RepID=A0A2V5HL16_ASPV1|nr:beta-ketoacyl synthase domain-containing protein [Aspergillus violaceofuscus CBS 115571]
MLAKTPPHRANEPIVVIGSGCRFPGTANSPSNLWELLRQPRDLLREIPTERFNAKAFHHPDAQYHGHSNVLHSYLLEEDVRRFDAQFFNIKPVEAQAMDPQQRLLLETVYEGLEAAGLTIEGLRGSKASVYAGLMCNDYEAILLRDFQQIPNYHATGVARSIVSNRISYFFDWHGPSLTVDTACSSTLIAVHLAVQALRAAETNVAFALIQDGRTQGITMPSATAQASLIRDTYARAGLDPRQEGDRCQYFEAHGTGTPAGDPIEAEAINEAFFGQDTVSDTKASTPLYVGSIKTVIGHTEGTAGLAAFLKASLALQHGVIPPNMLFQRINPRVTPFYDAVEVPTQAIAWPETYPGSPRRASVNSFGFGGSNAHAILESYQQPERLTGTPPSSQVFSPFVFSAHSTQSLVGNLREYSRFLETNSTISAQDLAWTLRARRSSFPAKVSFPAGSIQSLKANIDGWLRTEAQSSGGTIGDRMRVPSSTDRPRLLGIFTGQGAQYARMGAELIEQSPYAAAILDKLEGRLSQLPISDRPSWSLRQELLAKAASSRVHEAWISQPLCTAVQILLVDLLRLAGVQFSTVVGHSSGEIGAAYAAGYLSAYDAVCIAYYRGLHSKLAQGPKGIEGAMLAVGTSLEDAQDLLSMEEFSERVTVAACNSSSSVTLSGDKDAIEELEAILEDEGKFRRRLKVDKAYHSHHMQMCSDAYLQSLRDCNIRPQQPSADCVWLSSVYDDPAVDFSSTLRGPYWDENMVSPVLFSQAVKRAFASGPYDAVIEVGPHPALKGPATQTAQEVGCEEVLYTGLLTHGKESIGGLSNALGLLWVHLGASAIDIDRFERESSGWRDYQMVPNLPSYQWQHDRAYWHESRISRQMRQRQHRVHTLLGDLCPDSARHRMMWRNLLRPTEIGWIRAHQLQSQTVFPAAGYVATALEAVRYLVSEQDIRLTTILDFIIHQAMVFDDEDAGIEVLTCLDDVRSEEEPKRVRARFIYSAAVGKERDRLTLMASGEVEILLGEPSPDILPSRGPSEPNMIEAETDRFYHALEDLGYGYQGPFRALSALKRKLGRATGLVARMPTDPTEAGFMVHPAMLDAAIQSVILAYSYPNDGQLWSLHVPTRIRSAVPFASATEADDRNIFSVMRWSSAEAAADQIVAGSRATEEDYELAHVLERVSSFYLRRLDEDFGPDHPGRRELPYSAYFNYAAHVNQLVSSGQHPYAKAQWVDDSLEDIMGASKQFADCPDIRIMHTIGQQMPQVIQGQTTILEHLVPTGLLDEYYVRALGFPQFSLWLARTVNQIVQRYPAMDILEIGAGTGGATKSIFRHVQGDFASYTFTDISNGFFDRARTVFADHTDRMEFKALDIERPVKEQGFFHHSYDLIVASFVIHATRKLEDTMRHVRSLLKPGGFVVMAEVTNNDQIRGGFIFGALPGWWVGIDEGRVLTPCVSPAKWDRILRKTGFSGIDMITPDDDRFPYPGSVFISQAIDDRVQYLRHPLSPPRTVFNNGGRVLHDLHIIGGVTLRVSQLAGHLQTLLCPFCDTIVTWEDLEHIDYHKITTQSTVLVLTELDQPVFQDLTAERFQSLKQMFGSEKTIVWVTQGRQADNPFANMTVGFGRSLLWEVPDLRLQFIDLEDLRAVQPRMLAEVTLRFRATALWSKECNRQLMWSTEPEIVIDAGGRQLIPRLHLLKDANDRYNAGRRSILRKYSDSIAVAIAQGSDGSHHVRKDQRVYSATSDAVQDSIHLRLKYSTLHRMQTPVGYQSVILGVDASRDKDAQQYIALVEHPSSTLDVVTQSAFICALEPGTAIPTLIAMVAVNLFFASIVQQILPGQNVTIHNASPLQAHILSRRAKEVGVQVVYPTSFQEDPIHTSFPAVQIQPHMPRRSIKSLLPNNIACFIDLSSEATPAGGDFILDCLPSSCRRLSFLSDQRRGSGGPPLVYASHSIQDVLGAAISSPHRDMQEIKARADVPVVSLANIGRGDECPPASMPVVDWTDSASLLLQVFPVDSSDLFRSDRTYWLVGLTGSLGLSLCDWMIGHGARYIVLTSRRPDIDSRWLEITRSRGALVRVFASDMTVEENVRSVYEEICATLPPIAGVAQGAMVLRDGPTRDMSYEDMMQALRPKVQSSIHLDRLFSNYPLDFFIFFSSMTAVIGNMGQANYTAANAFMCALAAQRRKRGLYASVVNIGVIIGAGYVTREVSQADQKNLRKGGYMWMSETDFHQMFAEAIEAGRSTTLSEPEISTGLRQVPADAPYLPIWSENPKFSRFILRASGEDSQRDAAKAGGISIKDRLQLACTLEDARNIIADTFAAKLRLTLQIEDDTGDLMSRRTDELGLDSLIAVDIRSWFLKSYQVNVPVLKILGGASIAELVEQALLDLPAELIPNLGQQTESNTREGQKEELPSSPVPGEIPGEDSPAPVSYSDSVDHLSQAESSSPEEGHLTPISSVIDELAKSTADPRPIAAIQRSGRLSSTQSMFWFVHALMEDKTTLNHTAMFRLSGPLDVDRLREAVTAVGQRHEALRTCLVIDARQHITQAVLETSVLRLELRQIYADDEVMAEYEALKQHVYDLTSGETMRIVLLSGSPGHYHLLIGCHHINVDGISYQVLMADLECAYKGEPRDTPVLQYLDYADRQREEHEQGAWDQEIAFWERELGPIPSPLPPGRHLLAHRQPLHDYGVHSVKLRIGTALANRIREVVRTCKATAFHFYLAAFRILLHRYLNAQDVCIGISDGNRSGTGMLDSIGPYVNLLPLRFVARDGQSFQDALVEVKSRAYAALAHSQLPFEVLLNELRVARSPTHSPLFQAFVDYQQGTRERQLFGDLQLEMLHFEPGRTSYDISLDIIDNPGQDALVVVMAQRNLYSLGDAEVMAQIYEDILQEYSSIPSLAADKNWSFRQETLQKALDVGRGETLIHQFETQRHLHKTALHIANASSWSYEELGQRVDRIARELISCGAQPGDNVAVLQDRTADSIASMLATMKIGAVYVPLDPNVSLARLAKIVRDCDPVALLADSKTVAEGGGLAQPSAAVIINVSELAAYSSGSSLPNNAEPDATALILYTSGTTGTPKGVALQHSSFCHEVEVSVSTYSLTQDDHILQQSAVSFDMSVLQVFLALAQGVTLCMTSAAMRADPSAISAFIAEAGVTFTCATPSEYQSWLQSGHRRESLRLSAWRTALTGGEPATTALLHSFRDLGRPRLRLYNGYGPTETTCCSTKMELSYQNASLYAECVPAGRPSVNEAIYIVDQAMRLQPVGQPGEILIGGVGVASGYVNNEELTTRGFVADVFASPKDRQQGWTTMYRTKDYGHLRPDGSLIIEGRVDADTEIKLHGVRTDLMDIERSILQAAEGTLCNVAISVRSAAEKTFLVAHCAFSPTGYQSTAEQEQFLQALLPQLPLPQGMCPSAMVAIDQMPLTSAGKLDRRALSHLSLPASAESRHEATAISTLSDAETEMKGLWEEVIPEELWSHHRVDSQTDFFHVGGSSMLLVDLQARISNRIGTSIPLIRLFESSTLKGMALLIARTAPGDTTVGVLDWKTETSLTPDLARIVGPLLPSTPLPRCPPRVIVLTGASGFLGQHLLRHLLAQQQPVVDQVICIAVRQLADRAHLFAGLDRQRVVCYEGDLAAPRLGLKEDDAQRIFGTADAVIHNGADVSHLKNYHTLKGANVQSTQELVRLCLPRGIPLHYISTAGVAMFTTREVFAEVSAGDAQPPSDGSDGYTATKWVSELYLEQASQTFQLPVWIHRPSSVVRQERAGAAEAIDQNQDNLDARPMFDLLQSLLRYSWHLRAVPVSTNLKGSLDLVSVQNVARGVVKAVVAQSIDQRRVAYSHLTGDFDLPIDGLKEYLEGETGEAFAMLPIREWARRAEGAGLHRAVATVFSQVDELAMPLQFPRFAHKNRWKWMHGGELRW